MANAEDIAADIAAKALRNGYNITLETGADGSSKISAVAPDHLIRNVVIISSAVIVICFVVKWLFRSGGQGYGGTPGPVERPGGSSASGSGVNSAGSQVGGNLTSDMRSGHTNDSSVNISGNLNIFPIFLLPQETKAQPEEGKVGDNNESGLGPH